MPRVALQPARFAVNWAMNATALDILRNLLGRLKGEIFTKN